MNVLDPSGVGFYTRWERGSSTLPHGLVSPHTIVEEVLIFFPNVCLCHFVQHLGAAPLHGSVSGSSILVHCSMTSKPFYAS